MKYIVVSLALLLSAEFIQAQQDTIWKRGGLISINFSQISLTNWSAGGENSVAGNAILNYFANYKKGKNVWDNNFDIGYGLVIQGKNGDVTKSDDKIDLSTKYGRAAFKAWYYSALLNFRSQFSAGYNYPNDSIAISQFMAPGYLTFALGMDYKPSDDFSLLISPATVRFIFVNDKKLSDEGAFGVDSGKTLRTEIGAFLRASLKKDISTTANLVTSVDFFSNYLEDPQNIDVNWSLLLAIKVSKYLTASITTQLIYDDNTDITYYKDDGATLDHVGKGTQFKEVFGIGFGYKFSGVTVK